MRYTARRMASRLASSPKWQAVPGGLLALRALSDAGDATFRSAQARQGLRQDRQPRGAADAPVARHQAGAAVALQSLLRGDVGRPHPARRAAPPRRGSVRRRLRSPARRRRGGSLCQRAVGRPAPPEGGRHLPRAAPGSRRAHARLLHAERIRHRPAHRRASRTIASWSSAAPACSSPTATSGPSSCFGTGCGPTCASTRST